MNDYKSGRRGTCAELVLQNRFEHLLTEIETSPDTTGVALVMR